MSKPRKRELDRADEILIEAKSRAKRSRFADVEEDLPELRMRREEEEEKPDGDEPSDQHQELLGESPPPTILPSPHPPKMGELPPPHSDILADEDDCRVAEGSMSCYVAQGMLQIPSLLSKPSLSAAAA